MSSNERSLGEKVSYTEELVEDIEAQFSDEEAANIREHIDLLEQAQEQNAVPAVQANQFADIMIARLEGEIDRNEYREEMRTFRYDLDDALDRSEPSSDRRGFLYGAAAALAGGAGAAGVAAYFDDDERPKSEPAPTTTSQPTTTASGNGGTTQTQTTATATEEPTPYNLENLVDEQTLGDISNYAEKEIHYADIGEIAEDWSELESPQELRNWSSEIREKLAENSSGDPSLGVSPVTVEETTNGFEMRYTDSNQPDGYIGHLLDSAGRALTGEAFDSEATYRKARRTMKQFDGR